MTPVIRLGGELDAGAEGAAPPAPSRRVRSRRVEVGGVPTRAISTAGKGAPTILLHGWLDNADTWSEVLRGLAERERPAVAYDLPGFGVAPDLGPGSVLDQLVDFAAAAVRDAAERAGSEVVVAGNSLGGWVALRAAEIEDLPIAGAVPIGPAGVRMAPMFFTLDRVPAVSRVIGLPTPVPPALVRTVAGRLYRSLAFADPAAVERAVVDRFTRFTADRAVIRTRLDYAKRLRPELERPFDAERITVPVTVLWGERDRLCIPDGAKELAAALPHARIEMLPWCGHTPQVEAPDRVIAAIAELAG